MGKAIPPAVRAEIIRLTEQGRSAVEVSRLLGLGYPGVAKVCRQYRKAGESALSLGYQRCGRRSSFDSSLWDSIDSALSENKDLGAPIIRSRLLAQGALPRVPHERTIQRRWKSQGKNKPRGRRPRGDSSYTKEVHATWQIDGKEQVRLADDSMVCYLSFTDEATCSFLKGHVFPHSPFDETSEP